MNLMKYFIEEMNYFIENEKLAELQFKIFMKFILFMKFIIFMKFIVFMNQKEVHNIYE